MVKFLGGHCRKLHKKWTVASCYFELCKCGSSVSATPWPILIGCPLVCWLVVHWFVSWLSTGLLVGCPLEKANGGFHALILSESMANIFCYNFHLPITLDNQPANLCKVLCP